jgi:hypothetical protein
VVLPGPLFEQIHSFSLLAPSLPIAMTVAAPSSNGASTTSRPAAPRPIQRPTSALELVRTADRAVVPPAATHESAAAPQALPAQPSGFSPEQLAALAAPLDRANVRQREQGRGKVAYLEGWQVIAESNRIFGFDGWQRQTIAVRCVSQAERLIGRGAEAGLGCHLHRPRSRHRHCRWPASLDPRGQRRRPRHRRGSGPGP